MKILSIKLSDIHSYADTIFYSTVRDLLKSTDESPECASRFMEGLYHVVDTHLSNKENASTSMPCTADPFREQEKMVEYVPPAIDVVKAVYGDQAVPHSTFKGIGMDYEVYLQTVQEDESKSKLLEKIIAETPDRSIVGLRFDDYALVIEKAQKGFSQVN
jgi:hypothetical protein